MKKFNLILLTSLLVFSCAVPVVVQAQTPGTSGIPGGTGITEAPEVDPMRALDIVINVLFSLLLIFAAIMLIVAGFQFVTAGGDTEAVRKARDKVMYAVIGLLVAFVAKGVVIFVQRIFAGSGMPF